MSRLIRAYINVLQKHPWKTQAGTTGVLMATGDALAQLLVEKKKLSEYDFYRSSRFLIFGCTISGPGLRIWYLILEKVVRTKSVAAPAMRVVIDQGPSLRLWYIVLERVVKIRSVVAPAVKVALDQACMSPTFLTIFLGTMTYWKTKDFDSVKAKLRQDFKTVLLNNYKLWPMAQLINFYFVPFQHRILYVNVIAVFWNTYLAYTAEQGIQTEEMVQKIQPEETVESIEHQPACN